MNSVSASPAPHRDVGTGSTVIDAFHLPGLTADDVTAWEVREYGRGVTLRFPVLREGALTALLARMEASRRIALEPLPAAAIAHCLGRAAHRLAQPDDALRQLAERALPQITGYSPAMIRLLLDRFSDDWSEAALLHLLDSELPGHVLDGYQRRHGVHTRALGPRLAFHVFSGSVPGVAVTALVRTLLVKGAMLGKTASGDPLLTVLFARALASVDSGLADCLAVTYWPGGQSLVEDEAVTAADAIVVYGGGDAVRAMRSRAPATTRVIDHGPRVSIGLLGGDALASPELANTAAARVAWAVSLFDQQGCVSPHIVYVEEAGIGARGFAHCLAAALEAVAAELPRGVLSPAEAAAIHETRGAAEFRAIAGEEIELLTGNGWTVIYEADARFEASCLNRTVRIKRVSSVAEVPSLIEPVRGYLQTVAMEGVGARGPALADALARAGATRITDFARMPWPPPTWHHDGAGPLRELVRWVDVET